MCGDGANDCSALKTADAGISLSEAEASIAAPFTSSVQNIECVVTLLREGRCSMATALQSFKYIELYAMCEFSSVALLLTMGCNVTDR
jgi:P-type E1-E2 ATPase